MALTVNSTTTSNGQPSAPLQVVVIDMDFDNSYPTGGEALPAGTLPEGATIVWSEEKAVLDGALKHVAIDPATQLAQVFVDASGARGAEAGNASDQSGITGLQVAVIVQ